MGKKFLSLVLCLLLLALFSFSTTGFFLKDSVLVTKVVDGGTVGIEDGERVDSVLVTRVIDGDTIEIEGGERVRLLGIDTPEKGQYFSREATLFLKNLIEKKRVSLEKDISETDKYGRLLRYVFVGNDFINLEVIKNGYASVLLYEPDTKYASVLLEEEAKAKEVGMGIWSIEVGDVFCLGIHYFHSNAKGDDNKNLNDEYVRFRNKCFVPLLVKGWKLQDRSGNAFIFPDFAVENKSTVTVHSGSGKPNATDLFWGKSLPVWNNNGDSLFLWDAQGKLMLNYSYGK